MHLVEQLMAPGEFVTRWMAGLGLEGWFTTMSAFQLLALTIVAYLLSVDNKMLFVDANVRNTIPWLGLPVMWATLFGTPAMLALIQAVYTGTVDPSSEILRRAVLWALGAVGITGLSFVGRWIVPWPTALAFLYALAMMAAERVLAA